jgi:hypothetical protein
MCLCGHPAEHHVVDVFGTPFDGIRSAEQLGIPCLSCDCLDWHTEPEKGELFMDDYPQEGHQHVLTD